MQEIDERGQIGERRSNFFPQKEKKIFLEGEIKNDIDRELSFLRDHVLLCKNIQIFFQFRPLRKVLAHEALEMIIVLTFLQMSELMHHYVFHTGKWHAGQA